MTSRYAQRRGILARAGEIGVEAQLHEEENLRKAFRGCRRDQVCRHGLRSDDEPGERRGEFQRTVHPLLAVLKLFGVDMLEQNEWERDSLLRSRNGADGIAWVITRVVRPTWTPFVGAYAHRDQRGIGPAASIVSDNAERQIAPGR